MANEISVSISLTASKNGATNVASASNTITMAGDQMITNVQTIGTSSETLALGDVSTLGYLFIKNLDATNFILVDYVDTMDAFTQKLLAGESILLKPVGTTIYAFANTAPCNVLVVALEL